MKKKVLLPILIALPILIGGTTAAITYGSYENEKQAIVAYAEEIGSEEPTSEETTSEEESKWKEYYEKVLAMYDEIANKQVANTTVGGIISAVVSAAVSFLFSMLNKHRITQATETAKSVKDDYDRGVEELKELRDKYGLTIPKLDKAIEVFEIGSTRMQELLDKNEKLIAYCEKAEQNHQEDVNFLLEVISSSEELVRNGIAEKLNEKYGRK